MSAIVTGAATYEELRAFYPDEHHTFLRGRHSETGTEVVLKPAANEDQFNAEVSALRSLHHPHIVPLIDAFTDDGANYIVVEYCEPKDLRSGGPPQWWPHF